MRIILKICVGLLLLLGALRPAQALDEAELQRDAEYLERLNGWIEAYPRDFNSLSNRGKLYRKWGRCDLAIPDFDRLIEMFDSPAAYNDRGLCYKDLKKYDLAIADFNYMLSQDPLDIAAWINRGTIYYLSGAYQLAISDYSRALQIMPEDEEASYGRGLTHCMLKDFAAAAEDLKKACRYNKLAACRILKAGVSFVACSNPDALPRSILEGAE